MNTACPPVSRPGTWTPEAALRILHARVRPLLPAIRRALASFAVGLACGAVIDLLSR